MSSGTALSFENSRGLRLAADHFAAHEGAVVVMANDMLTHKRWRGRYPHIAQGLNAVGIGALAFDYCGTGESADDDLRPMTMIEDIRASVAQARVLGYRNVALWGHGLIAGLCIDAACDVEAMVLSAAQIGGFDLAAGLEDHERTELISTGVVTVPSMDPETRAQQVLDASLFRYLAAVEAGTRLRKLGCPVLFVHGNSPDDPEECLRLADNERVVDLLPAGSRLAVIDGARHSFAEKLGDLAALGVAWLRPRLMA